MADDRLDREEGEREEGRKRRITTDASAPDFRMPGTPQAAVELVVRIAETARDRGVESLAEDAARADSETLRAGLNGIASKRPAAEMQAAMGRGVTGAAADLGGRIAARRVVEAGLMMIRDGQDPETIRTNLGALLATEPGPTGR